MVAIIKARLALLSAGLIFSTLFIAACGVTNNNNDASSSATQSNDAGFYGESVHFGSNTIIGTWQIDNWQYQTYYADGTMTEELLGAFRKLYPQYGISGDGQTLTIMDESNTSVVLTFSHSDGNCFTATRDDAEIYWPVEFCEADNPYSYTLNPISNADASQNALGYFGDNVQLGNSPIIGSWGYLPIDGGTGHNLKFEQNGSGTIYAFNGEIIGPKDTFTYGVNEDGKTLSLQLNSQTDTYQITGLFEGCYQVLYKDNSYKLCKR